MIISTLRADLSSYLALSLAAIFHVIIMYVKLKIGKRLGKTLFFPSLLSINLVFEKLFVY